MQIQTALAHQQDRVDDGPFAKAALDLHKLGLAPLPLGGDDGKVPLLHRFTRWTRIPPPVAIEGWIQRWPEANVGIVTELSGVTVVDIDDPATLDDMLARFGDTPLKTGTPSGGMHLWYRSNGERSRTRIDGLPVDIKAAGGMVVVPPSVRPTGPHMGQEYTFLSGGWGDLHRLPIIKAGSLSAASKTTTARVQIGERNGVLFRYLLSQAPHCDSENDLCDVADVWNDDQPEEPLPDSNVAKTVGSAWLYQVEGRNWVGGTGQCQIPAEQLQQILEFSVPHGSDAVCLYLKLLKEHAARDGRGESFPVAPQAMAKAKSLPWTEYRIRNALNVLRDYPLLKVVKHGGSGMGDAHMYRFCSPDLARGRNTTHK